MNPEAIAGAVLDGHGACREFFDADDRKRQQAAIEDGQVVDVFPCRRRQRFGSITENRPLSRAAGGMTP